MIVHKTQKKAQQEMVLVSAVGLLFQAGRTQWRAVCHILTNLSTRVCVCSSFFCGRSLPWCKKHIFINFGEHFFVLFLLSYTFSSAPFPSSPLPFYLILLQWYLATPHSGVYNYINHSPHLQPKCPLVGEHLNQQCFTQRDKKNKLHSHEGLRS